MNVLKYLGSHTLGDYTVFYPAPMHTYLLDQRCKLLQLGSVPSQLQFWVGPDQAGEDQTVCD